MNEPERIRPIGRSVNDSILKRIAQWLLRVAVVTVCSVLGAAFLLEWMAGCGETYTDSKGVQHANECLFINR